MTVAELIEKLEELDSETTVLLYDSHRKWVTLKPDDMKIGTSRFQDCEPEERDKLLFVRHR